MKEHIAYFTIGAGCANAEETYDLFRKTQEEIAKNSEIYVLVLAGEGLPEAGDILSEEQTRLISEGMEQLRVPVIVVSESSLPEGYLGCDIVIVSENAMEEAEKMVEHIAKNAPVAVQQIKRCVNVGNRFGQDAGKAYELQAFSLCHSTEDKIIGMNALRNNESEKRFVNR